jgi:hypothetical protein
VLPRNGHAENKLRQGVTTAIGGEGGIPVPASEHPRLLRRLEKNGISINFGSYFSETQARSAVLSLGRAHLTRRSSTACARSWTRRCAPARWA